MTEALMKPEYEKELIRLTPRQHTIVMEGLTRKLRHYEKTGALSYAYDVCPVCKDVGSTLENQKCDECYIQKSCQAPFTDGFRDDIAKGVTYFREMRNILNVHIPPEIAIVGGTWGTEGKPSGVVSKLALEFQAVRTFNGGTISTLLTDMTRWPLVIWMPNIANEWDAYYPTKNRGAVLVCSKVMREGYTRADSVSRIFTMHANAVIEVRPREDGKFAFGLRDAMANWWAEPGIDLASLVSSIMELYWWTKGSIRTGSSRIDERGEDLQKLMELTHEVADTVENSIGERYFGNVSTRCQGMFPGVRHSEDQVLISPRNTDKKRLSADDMVLVDIASSGGVRYYGPRKPSVDTPVQLWLFETFPEINYFIHGHARVKDAPTTKKYFPCGDMREAFEIQNMIAMQLERAGGGRIMADVINLRNHGFLLYARTLQALSQLVAGLEFEEPNDG